MDSEASCVRSQRDGNTHGTRMGQLLDLVVVVSPGRLLFDGSGIETTHIGLHAVRGGDPVHSAFCQVFEVFPAHEISVFDGTAPRFNRLPDRPDSIGMDHDRHARSRGGIYSVSQFHVFELGRCLPSKNGKAVQTRVDDLDMVGSRGSTAQAVGKGFAGRQSWAKDRAIAAGLVPHRPGCPDTDGHVRIAGTGLLESEGVISGISAVPYGENPVSEMPFEIT